MKNVLKFSQYLKLFEGNDENEPETSDEQGQELVKPIENKPQTGFKLPLTDQGLPTIKDGVKYDLPDDETLKSKLKNLIGDKALSNFIQRCEQIGLPYQIALRQIWTESGFNPKAKSASGAKGLAQFMPISWPSYGKGNPFNPISSLNAYIKLMDELINKKFPKRLDLALAGYNWGPNRGVLKNALANEMDFSDIQKQLRGETRKYVHKILA
jgi:hypothetical protein